MHKYGNQIIRSDGGNPILRNQCRNLKKASKNYIVLPGLTSIWHALGSYIGNNSGKMSLAIIIIDCMSKSSIIRCNQQRYKTRGLWAQEHRNTMKESVNTGECNLPSHAFIKHLLCKWTTLALHIHQQKLFLLFDTHRCLCIEPSTSAFWNLSCFRRISSTYCENFLCKMALFLSHSTKM